MELLIEGYLEDEDMTLNELRLEASSGLRKNLKGTKYEIPLECEECESRLLYSKSKDHWFCPFCQEDD